MCWNFIKKFFKPKVVCARCGESYRNVYECKSCKLKYCKRCFWIHGCDGDTVSVNMTVRGDGLNEIKYRK
jgi:hypothetical protein